MIILILLEANVSSACSSCEYLPWVSTFCAGLYVRLGFRGTFPLWAKLSVLANLCAVATGLCGEWDSRAI